jgi:guanine deaminase
MSHEKYIHKAIQVAREGMNSQTGGPFGAIIVLNDKIIASASNGVTSLNDPTAHAEIQAIRMACQALKTFQLDSCILYSSCEPCPMCLGAIYWARPAAVYYAATQTDAASGGFDDNFIYQEISKPQSSRKIPFINLLQNEGSTIFQEWIQKTNKVAY